MKCGECGANFIMRDTRAYACSSHSNGGPNLCDNGIRVNREVAEGVILDNIKAKLLDNGTVRYVTKQFKQALREIEARPDDSIRLKNHLRSIDAKLAKLAEAIEAVGISDTLVSRLTMLEQEKTETELAIVRVPAPVRFLLDVIPALVQRWQELVFSIEHLGDNPEATLDDIEAARANLRALLGTVTLKPRDGVLWAHPSPNAKGLIETRPLDGLHINRPKVVAGARLSKISIYTQSRFR